MRSFDEIIATTITTIFITITITITWEAKEKLGLGEAPFLLRPTPPPAAWDPLRFRLLFAGLVASEGRVNYFLGNL